MLCLYPATPSWGVRLGCVCLGSGSGCALPLLAGVLGCVCVFVCALRLYPATPGWGVRCGCVCFGSGSGGTPPLLAGVLGCVCVFVCALRWYPATPGSGAPCGWVCFGSGFGSAPPPLAGVLGCACARSACTPPLLAGVCWVGGCAWTLVSAAPRHSWLGCWGVCALVCALRFHPATPGWGVQCVCVCFASGFGCAPPLLAGCGVCVRLFARSSCTPPPLAGVCGVAVCARAQVLAAPRHSWLGCWAVCMFVCALRLYPATSGWGSWCLRWVLPGTCSCTVVCCVLCALPGFAAPGGHCRLAPVRAPWLWPAACLSGVPRGPALVCSASSGPVALGAPVGSPDAVVPLPNLGGCARHVEAGREPGCLCLPLAPAEAGALGSLRVVPVRGPAMGLSLAGSSGVGLGLRALRWFACVDPVTDALAFY